MVSIPSKIVETTLPLEWETEGKSLSAFLTHVHEQKIATFANNPARYKTLDKIDSCFFKFTNGCKNPENLLCATFLFRAHSFFRAACGTALGGQCIETFALLRPTIENAAVALTIYQNPKLGETFLRRGESALAKKNSKTAFHPEPLRKLVVDADAHIGSVYSALYDRCIEFGAHINEKAITTGIRLTQENGEKLFSTVYSHPGSAAQEHALQSLGQGGLCALKIFQIIFKNRFMLLMIDQEIDNLSHNHKL